MPVDDHATLQISWRLDPSAKEPTVRHVELERDPAGRYDVRNTQYQDVVAMIGWVCGGAACAPGWRGAPRGAP